MSLSNSLRTLDELDGLRAPAPITPRWKTHEWPNASGIAKDRLGEDVHQAAYRINGSGKNDDWSALDDLASVISGFDRKDASGGWNTLLAANLVKIMTAFRVLGADDQLEVCLSPEYQAIVDAGADRADDQVRNSVRLSKQA